MANGQHVDEEFIPDEAVRLGDVEHNQQLRALAARKFEADYDLSVETEELVVAERSGYLAVWVTDGANKTDRAP